MRALSSRSRCLNAACLQRGVQYFDKAYLAVYRVPHFVQKRSCLIRRCSLLSLIWCLLWPECDHGHNKGDKAASAIKSNVPSWQEDDHGHAPKHTNQSQAMHKNSSNHKLSLSKDDALVTDFGRCGIPKRHCGTRPPASVL